MCAGFLQKFPENTSVHSGSNEQLKSHKIGSYSFFFPFPSTSAEGTQAWYVANFRVQVLILIYLEANQGLSVVVFLS